MNYTIIKNESALMEFIDWLPELDSQSRFYVSLLARNKYLSDKKIMGTDKIGLKAFISDKKHLYRKIKQLEIPYGAYVCGNDNRPVPQEALSLYIAYNPRDIVEATHDVIAILGKKVRNIYDGYNLESLVRTAFQNSQPKGATYFDFDYDFAEIEKLRPQIERCVNREAVTYIKTRGGFHLLVNMKKMNKEYEKNYVKNLSKIKGCDVKNSTKGMIPVPGCVQGGDFVPYIVK